MPNLGPSFDLASRLAAIEDQLRRMQANPLGQSFSATQSDGSVGMSISQDIQGDGGTLTRWYQGPTTGRDPSTGQHPLLAYIGQVFVGGAPVDSAMIFFRPGGSASLLLGSRGVELLDTQSNQVFSTDEYGSSPSGIGLNTPWIPLGQPIPAVPSNAGWPGTSASSMTEVSLLTFPAQHAQLTWYGYAWCPAGATGQVRVQLNNGAAGAIHTVGAGFTPITETIALGAGSWSWQEVLTLTGNAALTSGTGPIQFAIHGVWGRGSL